MRWACHRARKWIAGFWKTSWAHWKNGVDSYEIAPDHVTFYVWPRAADVKFRFLFRPRYAIEARSAQSTLCDFYNPDARVVLPPQTFIVGR